MPVEIQDIDVVLCVGHRDVERLFIHSLHSCLQHFAPLGRVYLVSDVPDRVRQLIAKHGLESAATVFADQDVLPVAFHGLPGWLRQQVIKLMADSITHSEYIGCMGADTIILRRVFWEDIVSDSGPILYFNRYRHPGPHLNYERQRIRNVANLLGVKPTRSLPLGDFVMDFNVFERTKLTLLRSYIRALHGDLGLLSILPERCDTLEDRALFGEWSLYAVYLLDVVCAPNEIRNSASKHLVQIHSQSDLERFTFDAKIVHFVNKNFSMREIGRRLVEYDIHSVNRDV
jgi:Family of unknown function (DUF6492)